MFHCSLCILISKRDTIKGMTFDGQEKQWMVDNYISWMTTNALHFAKMDLAQG